MAISDTIEPGTIIHGTLRECDLIPAFMDVLRDFAPAYAARITDEYGAAFIERCSDPSGLDYSLINEMERQTYLLSDLFDALEEIAPDGLTFGAIEGDGSDFGFWSVED
jgi:hypothetical protein